MLDFEAMLKSLGIDLNQMEQEAEDRRGFFEEPICPHEKAWLELWVYMAEQLVAHPTDKVVLLSMIHLYSSMKTAIALNTPCDGWDLVFETLSFEESRTSQPERGREIYDAFYAKMKALNERIIREYAELEKQRQRDIEKN